MVGTLSTLLTYSIMIETFTCLRQYYCSIAWSSSITPQLKCQSAASASNWCYNFQSSVKLHCFTNKLIIFLSEFVWTISMYMCLCVCLHVCIAWSSEVERCQCQCSPSVLTLSWWLPSKCLHLSNAAHTHILTHKYPTIFKCKGNSSVSIKAKANRVGDFKGLSWVTTPPTLSTSSGTYCAVASESSLN